MYSRMEKAIMEVLMTVQDAHTAEWVGAVRTGGSVKEFVLGGGRDNMEGGKVYLLVGGISSLSTISSTKWVGSTPDVLVY